MKTVLTALITALLISPLACTPASQRGEPKFIVAPKVPIKAYAFSLNDVRLLGGKDIKDF